MWILMDNFDEGYSAAVSDHGFFSINPGNVVRGDSTSYGYEDGYRVTISKVWDKVYEGYTYEFGVRYLPEWDWLEINDDDEILRRLQAWWAQHKADILAGRYERKTPEHEKESQGVSDFIKGPAMGKVGDLMKGVAKDLELEVEDTRPLT